jgi:hypothetical protein
MRKSERYITEKRIKRTINPHFFTDEIVSTFVDTAADRLGDIFKEWDKNGQLR